jgi:hypothetical protein
MERLILALAVAGQLTSSGAAVAGSGSGTAALGGDGDEALTRSVVTTGICQAGARYRATMENATYTDESGPPGRRCT